MEYYSWLKNKFNKVLCRGCNFFYGVKDNNMSEIIKLNMVSEYWKHSDEGLRDERNRMAKGFAFYTGDPRITRIY
jgi:hypothetical protein